MIGGIARIAWLEGYAEEDAWDSVMRIVRSLIKEGIPFEMSERPFSFRRPYWGMEDKLYYEIKVAISV